MPWRCVCHCKHMCMHVFAPSEPIKVLCQGSMTPAARCCDRCTALRCAMLQSVQVALPTTHGGLQTRSHMVVIKPGVEQGPEFIDRVGLPGILLHPGCLLFCCC